MDVDRDDVVKIGQLQFCHFGFPTAAASLRKTRIDYSI
jgi:hypothetical protein